MALTILLLKNSVILHTLSTSEKKEMAKTEKKIAIQMFQIIEMIEILTFFIVFAYLKD